MFKATFACAALMAFVSATTEVAQTCIDTQAHLFGVAGDNDLPFTDFNYLSNSEQFDTIYRLTRVQLCDDQNGELTGLRAHVTRFDPNDMSAISRISMNKIGTVDGDGISCSSIVLDALNDEYLSDLYFAYENPGKLDYIRAQSNKDQTVSKGTLTSTMQTSEMTNIGDNRILAFHGYESNILSSIGQISVQFGCIKGVTTVETVEEPVLIDVSTLSRETAVEASDNAWIYILVGVLIGVMLMVSLAVTAVMWKQRKGCFKSVVPKTVQTMPMGASAKFAEKDLEFARQSSDQKRRSMKQMSKIVEVNESKDIESQHTKQKMGDNMNSDNNVQSMQSLAQVTDTEDAPSKRQTS